MNAVIALLFALVSASQALYLGSPLTYGAYAAPAVTYGAYHAPAVTYGAYHAAPVVYSAPKVKNVEIATPVITKANLNVVTDADEISTTEIKPAGFYGAYSYPYYHY